MKNIKLTIITVIALVAIIGFAYSKWSFKNEQNDPNVFGSSCLNTSILETDGINLENAFPITAEEANDLTPYTFKLTNNCDIPELVQINLELFNNTLSTSQVDYKLNDKSAKVVSLPTTTPLLSGATSSHTILTDTLNAGETKSYDLRLWLDEGETAASASNKTFESKIAITTSYGK